LEGGDPRTLSLAVNRTTHAIVEKEDPTIFEANQNVNFISELEKCQKEMKSAMSALRLDSLSEALPIVKVCISNPENRGGAGVITRAFGGRAMRAWSMKRVIFFKSFVRSMNGTLPKRLKHVTTRNRRCLLWKQRCNPTMLSLEGAFSQANKALLSKSPTWLELSSLPTKYSASG